MKSAENSIRGLMRAISVTQKEYALDNDLRSITFTYENGVGKSSVPNLKLNYTGKSPKDGKIIIGVSGKTYVALHDGKYCIEKDYESDDIRITKRAINDCGFKIELLEYIGLDGANSPRLLKGMTPIVWNEDGTIWEETIDINESEYQNWFDYDRKQWANAQTADGSYWVWIPRFAYQIESGYQLSSGGKINIVFLDGVSDEPSIKDDSIKVEKVPEYDDNNSQINYVVHPAFNFSNPEDDPNPIAGFWVAKFEPSGSGNDIKIVPGVKPLVNQNMKSQYDSARAMENDSKFGWKYTPIDTHMMKNIEWGAVTYLTNSRFGQDTHVAINSADSYSDVRTGGGEYDAYMENTDQSTTGTIYGIYDMSGGMWERTMANLLTCEDDTCERTRVTNIESSSSVDGFDQAYLNSIEPKYIDEYKQYDETMFGDAVYETSSDSSGSNSWYNEYSSFPHLNVDGSYSGRPWFHRGGRYDDTAAGVFSFGSTAGISGSHRSIRPDASVSVESS